MGGPAPAGVFRSGGTAMDHQALEGALNFGNVEHKSLPCQGSRGRTQTYQVPTPASSCPVPVTARRRRLPGPRRPVPQEVGRQGLVAHRHRSPSRSPASSSITDMSSRAGCGRRRASGSVQGLDVGSARSPSRASPSPYPTPGDVVELPDGAGRIQRQLVDTGYRGSQVIGLRVSCSPTPSSSTSRSRRDTSTRADAHRAS